MTGQLKANMTAHEACIAAHDDHSTGAVIQALCGERDEARLRLQQLARSAAAEGSEAAILRSTTLLNLNEAIDTFARAIEMGGHRCRTADVLALLRKLRDEVAG